MNTLSKFIHLESPKRWICHDVGDNLYEKSGNVTSKPNKVNDMTYKDSQTDIKSQFHEIYGNESFVFQLYENLWWILQRCIFKNNRQPWTASKFKNITMNRRNEIDQNFIAQLYDIIPNWIFGTIKFWGKYTRYCNNKIYLIANVFVFLLF